jgi:hypothetical protein
LSRFHHPNAVFDCFIPDQFDRPVLKQFLQGKMQFAQSPLFITLQNGLERLLEVLQTDEFMFIVNGESQKSTVLEAVLISPKIHENLRSSPGSCTFCINDENITAKDFSRFLDFIHSRVFKGFSREEQLSFVSICELLGNDGLTFLLIESLRMISEENGERREETSGTISDSKEVYLSEIDVNHCASNFHFYSIELLRRLSKETLHNIFKSPFLKLVDEDELLRLLIELGSDYFEFWNYIEVINLTGEGISLFVDHLDFNELTESIWQKIVVRLKSESEIEIDPRSGRYVNRVIGFESLIVHNYLKILTEFEKNTWKLLYRGSRDGFKASNFHGECDNQSNTLTLIETTKGFIFGGFTPIPWDSSSGYKADNSQKSFLFTLKNPNKIFPRKFQLSNASSAIWSSSSYGPIFGGGHDICLYDNFNTGTNHYSNLGSGYVNDTGIDGKQVLTGEYNFTVKEIEVFSIIL